MTSSSNRDSSLISILISSVDILKLMKSTGWWLFIFLNKQLDFKLLNHESEEQTNYDFVTISLLKMQQRPYSFMLK